MPQREKSFAEDLRWARARESASKVRELVKRAAEKATSIAVTWKPSIFDEPADTQDEPEFYPMASRGFCVASRLPGTWHLVPGGWGTYHRAGCRQIGRAAGNAAAGAFRGDRGLLWGRSRGRSAGGTSPGFLQWLLSKARIWLLPGSGGDGGQVVLGAAAVVCPGGCSPGEDRPSLFWYMPRGPEFSNAGLPLRIMCGTLYPPRYLCRGLGRLLGLLASRPENLPSRCGARCSTLVSAFAGIQLVARRFCSRHSGPGGVGERFRAAPGLMVWAGVLDGSTFLWVMAGRFHLKHLNKGT
ncbi:hypothetical protein M2368_003558 [Arthrobacter sp. JUb119]|nr:hypothetical protein [Arthrobacter sp. JUb119]TDU22616.1 hypothetical protein EDF61_109146 [Arthrobacter sp. JUb115]